MNKKSSKNQRFEIIKPYLKDKKVLDIGVVQHKIENIEKGKWLHRLIRHESKQTVGIDIDEEGVNYLKKRGYDVRVADAQSFDLGEKFDVIIAGEIIEHLTNFDGFLKSIKKHMNPNSKFIITTPNVFFIRRNIQIVLEGKPRVNPEHTCWFDEETLIRLLRRYDFKIDAVLYTPSALRFRLLPLPKKIYSNILIIISRLSAPK